MTKPLFEPSTPREVAGNSWGVSQLQRRPAEAAAAGAFHGWAVQMSSSAVTDTNTYWGGFGMDIPMLWFDTTVCDTDAYLVNHGDAASGSEIQIPSGLGGFYTVTARLAFGADTPLVAGAAWGISATDGSEGARMLLDPDMIDSQPDEWFQDLTCMLYMGDFESIFVSTKFSSLSNPTILDLGNNTFYTSLMGVYHGACP